MFPRYCQKIDINIYFDLLINENNVYFVFNSLTPVLNLGKNKIKDHFLQQNDNFF